MRKECAIVIPNLELVAPVAFGRDNPNTTVQFLDIGHLALPKRMLKKSPSRCGISGSQLWRRHHHRSGNESIGCWIGLRRGPHAGRGENEADDGKRFPSDLSNSGAIKKTAAAKRIGRIERGRGKTRLIL